LVLVFESVELQEANKYDKLMNGKY
jgi:hypothetical protein